MSKSCIEQNGRLELSINNEPGYREVGYALKSFVVAAFKAYISFSSYSATGTSGFKLEYWIDANNYVSVARTGGNYTSKICVAGTLSTVTGGSADASGTLHIERTGMIVRTYYGGGAGTLISSSTTFSTDPGKMKIVLYAAATLVAAAYVDDFVLQESSNSLFDSQFTVKQQGADKLSVSRRGHRDYKNKITVQWTKRGYGYMAGTVDCQDLVDMDANGSMDVAMRLEGICTLSRADKMGRLFLKKNVNQCEVYAGSLGPQSFGTAPGSIVYLSSKRLSMSNIPARVLAVKEGTDYQLEVEFSEEKEIYELDSYAWDNTSPAPNVQYSVNVAQAIRIVDSFYSSSSRSVNTAQALKLQESISGAMVNPNLKEISNALQQMSYSENIGIYATWNSADKNAGVTLSNGNLTATSSSSSAWQAVRSTMPKNGTGKYYFEVTCNTLNANGVMIGISDNALSLSSYPGNSTYSWGWWSINSKYYHNSGETAGPTYAQGDIVMVAFDISAGKLWFGKNGTWNNQPGGGNPGNPAAGTYETYSGLDATAYYATASLYNSEVVTINCGQSALSYKPSGFSALSDLLVIIT
jgi:hypothetical protein